MGLDLEMFQTAVTDIIVTLLTAITLFLPRLLNAAILLLLGWLLGRLAATLISRLLTRIGFDRLVTRGGLAQILTQADVRIQPSDILARLVNWLLLLTFLLAAVDVLGLQTAAETIRELISYIPNVIGAILVLVGGGLLARLLGTMTQTIAASADLEFHYVLGQIVRYFLLALTFVLVAGQLGLNVTFLGGALANLVVVTIAVVGLSFALGGRDLVKNLLAGIYAKDIFTLGQVVRLQNHEGRLEAIGTLKSKIQTDEEQVSIPNSLLINEIVIERNMRPD